MAINIDNKGLIINGEQLIKLINDTISNILINVDVNSMSRTVIEKKFSLINDFINKVNDKLQEREFDLDLTTGQILFSVGEHSISYLNLNITLVFINNTNEELNKEININIPKSIFMKFLSNNKSIIEPYIYSMSNSLITEDIFYRIDEYTHTNMAKKMVLGLSIDPKKLEQYDSVKVIVNSLASNFEELDTREHRLTKTFVYDTLIKPSLNIGNNSFITDDGTVVRSKVVRNINLVSKEDMDRMIDSNNSNPGDLSLVPISLDESDRLLEIVITTKENNTQLSLSDNVNQSLSYKVNWGDNNLDNRLKHTYVNAGTYTIKIYNRIDDLNIYSVKDVDLTSISIPSGYRTPTEWNNPIITNPLTGGLNSKVVFKATKFPGNLFIFGTKIIRVNGLVTSDTITSVDPTALNGLVNTTLLDTGDLFKNITSVSSNIYAGLESVRVLRGSFKNSKITSLPSVLLDPLESLEDMTSFAENSKLTSLPSNFGSTCYNLKVADYAFKNIPTLNDFNATSHFESLIVDKVDLRSIKGLYESTPVVIDASNDTLNKINSLTNIMDLSSAFKGTKFNNEDLIFTIRNLTNLYNISSIFESVSTFNVNGPLLENCVSINNETINVSKSLLGTNLNFSATSDDDIFVDTDYDGGSGISF